MSKKKQEQQMVFILQETFLKEGFAHIRGDHPSYEVIHGVFASKEAAEEARERMLKEDRGEWIASHSQGIAISQWEVVG